MPFGPWPGGRAGNNPWLNLFAARAKLVSGGALNVDDWWEFGDGLARVGVTKAGAGTVLPGVSTSGGILDLSANGAAGNYAVASPSLYLEGGVDKAPAWVPDGKKKWYVETLSWETGAVAGVDYRAALCGAWTGGDAVNAGSLVSLGRSPRDYSKIIISIWDGATWNEVTTGQGVADIGSPQARALYCDGLNIFAFQNGVQMPNGAASVNGFGPSPTALTGWTLTSQNLANMHTLCDLVYIATERGQ